MLVSHKDRDYPHSIVFCEPSPESRHPRTGKIDRNALDKQSGPDHGLPAGDKGL